jgi:hypothetical protein
MLPDSLVPATDGVPCPACLAHSVPPVACVLPLGGARHHCVHAPVWRPLAMPAKPSTVQCSNMEAAPCCQAAPAALVWNLTNRASVPSITDRAPVPFMRQTWH